MTREALHIAVLIALLTAFSSKPAEAQEIKIVDYGLYTARDVKVMQDPKSPTGQARTIETDLAKQTELVPAVLNTKFGFRFKVIGLPEGTTARLRLRFTFPEMTNPNTGKVSTVYEGLGDIPVAPKVEGMFWDLVHSWEMRPGEWTMSIYNGDHLLAQKTFIVTQDEKSGARDGSGPKRQSESDGATNLSQPVKPARIEHQPLAQVADLHVGRDHMPLYRVTIHGRNFRLKTDGKWEKFGFYTPRFAEAPDVVIAERVALEEFRLSPKYQDLMGRLLNANNDPPILSGEDITQVSDVSDEKPAGLALYRESNV